MADVRQLNNIDHKDIRVDSGYGEAFGNSVNQTVVFPTEYDRIQREYPILIQKDADGHYQSVALLGLDRDENLYLDSNGWNARYIPAMHQRGAFMIGFQEVEIDGDKHREPMIYIDLDSERINTDRAQLIFLPHGGNTLYLNNIMEVLRTIHDGSAIMQPMFATFEALGLLETTVIDIALNDREHYKLEDYYILNQTRLTALDGADLQTLNQAGYLAAAFSIASSIGNAQHLIAVKNRKLQDEGA
jgi:SapC